VSGTSYLAGSAAFTECASATCALRRCEPARRGDMLGRGRVNYWVCRSVAWRRVNRLTWCCSTWEEPWHSLRDGDVDCCGGECPARLPRRLSLDGAYPWFRRQLVPARGGVFQSLLRVCSRKPTRSGVRQNSGRAARNSGRIPYNRPDSGTALTSFAGLSSPLAVHCRPKVRPSISAAESAALQAELFAAAKRGSRRYRRPTPGRARRPTGVVALAVAGQGPDQQRLAHRRRQAGEEVRVCSRIRSV